MRAENCLVAVKMLPEYADELSRNEFVREICLMKTLGYHERLVNMLACITESEPLCLVVEYCSDGDLLNFLRERCKYMIQGGRLPLKWMPPESIRHYEFSTKSDVITTRSKYCSAAIFSNIVVNSKSIGSLDVDNIFFSDIAYVFSWIFITRFVILSS
uniref:Protein kinase domain-containing protein n=1 Tax=Heterorhabditis bacteriophora TaxID=37862 RepID=A0A1I7X0M7_HETBA